MTKITVTEVHSFINISTGKTCKVISERKKDCVFHVTFRGWNPFPCFSMETSWNPLIDWMTNNGWIELAGVNRTVVEKEVKS